MSANNIEHAGVHYASHTLMDVQRELERELNRDANAHALIKPAKPKTLPRPTSNATSKRSSMPSAANQGLVPADAAAGGNSGYGGALATRNFSGTGKATDLLGHLGNHPTADYTARQLNVPPPVPLAVLKDTVDTVPVDEMLVTAESGRRDVLKMLMAKDEGELELVKDADAEDEGPEMDEDESAATDFIKRNPRYRNEFLAILKQLRQHRHEREELESLEDLARNALADVWCLQWEDLYEFSVVCRKRAAEDKRARLSHEHWHERLDVRRKELELALEEREREDVFHTEDILAELDMKHYLEWWNEQLASFELSLLMISGPEGMQFVIEDKPASPTAA